MTLDKMEQTWKLTLGGSVLVFLIGATFWAGSTYNRIDGIERQLTDISTRLARVDQLGVMEIKLETIQQQIKELQDREDHVKGR
jgi:hypothetical protein